MKSDQKIRSDIPAVLGALLMRDGFLLHDGRAGNLMKNFVQEPVADGSSGQRRYLIELD